MLDFLVDVIRTRSVLGCGLSSSPIDLEGHLGVNFVDDFRRKQGRRDYGLIEFFFELIDRSWKCHHFTVQCHRLKGASQTIIPEAIRKTYGTFAPSIEFEQLSSALAEHHLGFRRGQRQPEYDSYLMADDGIRLLVVGDNDADPGIGLRAGDVWSLSIVKESPQVESGASACIS